MSISRLRLFTDTNASYFMTVTILIYHIRDERFCPFLFENYSNKQNKNFLSIEHISNKFLTFAIDSRFAEKNQDIKNWYFFFPLEVDSI